MSNVSSATFFCDSCGEPAGSLELFTPPGERVTLRVEGPAAQTTIYLEADKIEDLRQAINSGSADTLYCLHFEYAPFYCPECAKNYCRACWRLVPVFDSDFPGWYDCTEGYCPQNHRRLIDD